MFNLKSQESIFFPVIFCPGRNKWLGYEQQEQLRIVTGGVLELGAFETWQVWMLGLADRNSVTLNNSLKVSILTSGFEA